MSRPQVIVVGAGLAGLTAARELTDRPWRRGRVDVTVVDQRNYHAVTPSLAGVLAGVLDPARAAIPIRPLVGDTANVTFRHTRVEQINLHRRLIETTSGPLRYDHLILAAGAEPDTIDQPSDGSRCYYAHDLEGIVALREQMARCMEAATWPGQTECNRLLSVAVIGAGRSGVALARALSALAGRLAGRDFPGEQAQEIAVRLIEERERVLPAEDSALSAEAAATLDVAGVAVECDARVAGIDDKGISLHDGRRIESATVVWAGGLRASPLAQNLPVTGSQGRAVTETTLQVDRHPEVFVVGDMAELPGPAGPQEMSGPAAIASGRHAGRAVRAVCSGGKAPTFHSRTAGCGLVHNMCSVLTDRRHSDVDRKRGRIPDGTPRDVVQLAAEVVPTLGAGRLLLVVGTWASALALVRRRRPFIAFVAASEATDERQRAPEPRPEAARDPGGRARTDLPSVNVANANRFGRTAALAWWTQDLPGRRPEPSEDTSMLGELRAVRARMVRLRQAVTGDRSSTASNGRG